MNHQNRRPSVRGVKPPALALLLLALALIAVVTHRPAQAAGNSVTIESVTATAGSSGSLAITLDNSDAVASGQVRFTYAASMGLTITGVQVASRTTGFASTGSVYNTGNASLAGYQVLFYNLSNLTIAPGTGVILTISYTLAPTASGSTALHFTQAILANAAAQALTVTAVDGALTIADATATTTATATSTATATPTVAPTATTTPTPTTASTVTPTVTNTPTETGTVTNTATATPVAANTETPATATPSSTLIATATALEPTATSTATGTTEPEGVTSTPTPVLLLPAQIYLPLIQR